MESKTEVQTEEVAFDEFDVEHLAELQRAAQTAQRDAQSFVDYLAKRHKIAGEGWRITSKGFVRALPKPPAGEGQPPPAVAGEDSKSPASE